MKGRAVLNEMSIKAYVFCREILPLVTVGMILACFMTNRSFAEGVNHLSGLRDDVSKTFGAGSDMQYFILLAEAIGGAYAYSKTKNIMVLTGVPILMGFTHWALK